MKLTEDDIEVGKKLAFKIHAGSSQLKQQILDDYEKARKWDINGKTMIQCIKEDSKLREDLQKLIKRVGKMEQMEYGYFSWEDTLESPSGRLRSGADVTNKYMPTEIEKIRDSPNSLFVNSVIFSSPIL